MTGRTVVDSIVRATIGRAVMHGGVAGLGRGCVTGRAIQGVPADPFDALVTGRAGIVGVGRRRMVTCRLFSGRTTVAQFTVVNGNRCCTRMTIRTRR